MSQSLVNHNSNTGSNYSATAAAAANHSINNSNCNNYNSDTTEEALDALWEKVAREIARIDPGESLFLLLLFVVVYGVCHT